MLKIAREVKDGVVVLKCTGRMTLGEGSSDFRDAIGRETPFLPASGKKPVHILLDLAGVSYVDRSGIGELVCGFTRAQDTGGALKFLAPSKRLTDLLQITKLYSVFEIFNDEAVALKSFEAQPVAPGAGSANVKHMLFDGPSL